ncbi:MAG: hypothetical protein K2V38_27980, partial [Gemmataceae bacterium]|nr:hypothetical protein [Gemmataceae bacterium]
NHYHAKLSPDGSFFAVWECNRPNIRLFDSASGQPLRELPDFELVWTQRQQWGISPNGAWLAAVFVDYSPLHRHQLHVASTSGSGEVFSFTSLCGGITGFEFSPDSERILLGMEEGMVQVCEVPSRKIRLLECRQPQGRIVGFGTGQSVVLEAAGGATVRVPLDSVPDLDERVRVSVLGVLAGTAPEHRPEIAQLFGYLTDLCESEREATCWDLGAIHGMSPECQNAAIPS